jgi:hypothetical protein
MGAGMRLLSIILIALVSFPCLAAAPTHFSVGSVFARQPDGSLNVTFTIITTKGYVSFSIPEEWGVMQMQSEPPVAVVGIQIPDSADSPTSDAANLSLSLIQVNTPEGARALNIIGKRYEGQVVTSSRAGWDVYSQKAHQNGTLYTIVDAKKGIADVIAAVRIAWPELANHSSEYDKSMENLFYDFLSSFDGNRGLYLQKQGEVARRPNR